jgi:hypothetical protein
MGSIKGRFQIIRLRLGKAWKNVKAILREGWSPLSRPDRKAIVRALVTIIVVIAIGGVVLWILRIRPKRMVQASLVCKSVDLPVPFHTIVHYGTEQLRLWEFEGTAEECDRDSIQPRPRARLERFVTLNLNKTGLAKPWLRMIPNAPGQKLEIDTPAGTAVSLCANGTSPCTVDAMNLLFETKHGDEANVEWQLELDSDLDLWQDGMEIRPLALPPEESAKIHVSPIKTSAIVLKFRANSPNAVVSIAARPSVEALVLKQKEPKPINIEVKGCNVQSLVFERPIPIEPTTEATGQISFADAVVEEIGMKLAGNEPGLAVNVSGNTREVLIGGINKNPSFYDDVVSTGPAGQGLLGFMVLGFSYFLASVGKKAVDVLAEIVVIPAKPKEGASSGNDSGNDFHAERKEQIQPENLETQAGPPNDSHIEVKDS